MIDMGENKGAGRTTSDSVRHAGRQARPGQRGFTLFELVSYILVVSIISSVAFNRFADFPGEAERANFIAIMMQLKAGVNLSMMDGIAGGNFQQMQALEGSNPMDLMLETPVNYLGEFSLEDTAGLPRRVWYFDAGSGELVYLANNSDNLYRFVDGQQVATEELRFRIRARFRDEQARLGWQGLLLEPVQPYRWEAVDLSIPAMAVR
ncbi:MAG: hypothetical protein RQ757_03820 [Pseudomonadales bacterium]|nr:hypothetical protein [Pseudomonadales bacterium]